MKTMVTLRKLMDEVEEETLDAETTLIDTNGISVLDENYGILPDQADPEDQED